MNSIFQNRLYDWLTTACQLIVLGFLFLFTRIPLVTLVLLLPHSIIASHGNTQKLPLISTGNIFPHSNPIFYNALRRQSYFFFTVLRWP